jgi:RNase adaptor protein for sRNA GlmZ degradation
MQIIIQSFSFRDNPSVTCTSDFVFDLRGIYNIGTVFTLFKLTGKDKPVQLFLDQTGIHKYMDNVYNLISSTIDTYIKYNYDNPIIISFGCIGGKHRSVYAAELTKKYIQDKYNNPYINIIHTNSQNW